MPEPPAVNSSPLIILSRAGLIDLLRVAGPQVLVVSTVAEEIARYGPDDITAQTLADTEWIRVVETPPIPTVLRGLDAGEAGVIAWALDHPGTTAIVDDQTARRRAAALGVPIIGTLGLILEAKDGGVIGEAGSVIERARRAGLYLSDRLVRDSLRLAAAQAALGDNDRDR